MAFPRGAAGIGLLVLRLLLAGSLIAASVGTLARLGNSTLATVGSLALLAAAALIGVGALTLWSLISVVTIEGARLILPWLVPAFGAAPVLDWPLAIHNVVLAAGLAFIGPGAYSIDAYVFGPRELTIPPRHS